MPDYGTVLRELIPFFEQEKIRFALAGGFALQALGRTRLTFDLDLIVPADVQERIVGHMEGIGFETLRVSVGYSNHVREKQRVDFIYLQSKTAELVLNELKFTETSEGMPLPIARPEYLAMMKFLAVKNNPERDRQDLPDLVFLLRLPGINRDEIREYCAKHGLLDLFNELTR